MKRRRFIILLYQTHLEIRKTIKGLSSLESSLQNKLSSLNLRLTSNKLSLENGTLKIREEDYSLIVKRINSGVETPSIS